VKTKPFKYLMCARLLPALLACAISQPLSAQDTPAAPPQAKQADGAKPKKQMASETEGKKKRTSQISDEVIPLTKPEDFPQRPKPLLELGNPFLGSGDIEEGFTLPTGAVWQPSLLVYGTYRTAIQTYDPGNGSALTEWANSLELFGNLQLSGTERLLIGFNPLAQNGRFTGYNFNPANDPSGSRGFEDEYNGEITTLFFEGDFGEIFPNADPDDTRSLDWGFSVGRQPLSFQDGMLLNDTIDSIGIIRNTLLPQGGSDFQYTIIYGWDDIHRDDNLEDEDTYLLGLFTQADFDVSTVNLDIVWVDDKLNPTDGVYWGASMIQRIGHYNTTFRVLGSHALETQSAAVSNGYLAFVQVATTPAWTRDIVYVNGFVGIDNYSSAARGPSTGGPLGQAGILFSAVGLGRYGAALGNRADESFGGSIGYQAFLGKDGDSRRQLIFEFGGRNGTTTADDRVLAAGVRYVEALDQHWVLQGDLFGASQENMDDAYGVRLELRFEF
jgi:hypothetical protein